MGTEVIGPAKSNVFIIWSFTEKACQFLVARGIAIVSFLVFLVIFYSLLNPSSSPLFLCEGEFPQNVNSVMPTCSLWCTGPLKKHVSTYRWSPYWPCPLAIMKVLCPFQPWHMLFFWSEYPPFAFVLNNKLRFYFLQEALSDFHRPTQWLTQYFNSSIYVLCSCHRVSYLPVTAVNFSQGRELTFLTLVSPVASLELDP